MKYFTPQLRNERAGETCEESVDARVVHLRGIKLHAWPSFESQQ